MGNARFGAIALGISIAVVCSLGLAVPAQAGQPVDSTLSVSGQLVVITDFGSDLVLEDHAAPHADPQLTYSVITDDGALLALDGDFADSARTGDRFEGTVVIPDSVASGLSVAPGTAVDAESDLGADVVDAAATEEAPLVVEQSEVSAPPVDHSVTPGAHTMDVVILTGKATAPENGAVGIPTAEVAAITAQVGAYWEYETDGGISEFDQPLAPTSLIAACPASESAYNAVWTAAAATFSRPVSDYTNNSGRHLIVILPSVCNNITGTGLGTIGSSVHQGGLNFVSNYSDVAVTTMAHEIGHNIGLGHGNLNYCGTLSYDEGAGCSFYEYNDVYSVMGYAIEGFGDTLPALPASQRDYLKGFGSGELAVQAPTSGSPLSRVTYTLKPASDSSGLRGIKVTDPSTGLVYYVELRSGTGSDSGAFYTLGDLWRPNGSGAEVIGTGIGVRVLQLDTSNLAGKGAMSKVFSVVTNPAYPTVAFTALFPAYNGQPAEDFNSRSGGLRIQVDALSPNVDAPTSATVTITTGGWSGTNPPPSVTRISGADRYATSAAVAQNYASANIVYVANGGNYPDALSAAPAAAFADAPLLLTERNSLPSVVAAQIQRLQPESIVIVGGTGVVSDSVATALEGLYPGPQVVRIPGVNRYATSRAITEFAFGEVGATTAFIATGRNFPDALSASAAADKFAAPVILVDGNATSADIATKNLLTSLGVTKVYVIGGTGVVSNNVMNSLATFNPERLSGSDRYATSVAINSLFTGPISDAYIANGTGFADALSGAALAGKNNGPLYISPGTCVPPAAFTQLDGLSPTRVSLLGGTGALTAAVAQLKRC